MPESYSVFDTADFFLQKAKEADTALTPLKLQKLCYFGYGWVAGGLDRELFEESFEAWKHGPVVGDLYLEFSKFKGEPIDRLTNKVAHTSKQLDSEVAVILSKVWDMYSKFSGWELRDKTHNEGTPWEDIFNGHSSQIIPYNTIRDYFKEKITPFLA